MIRLSTLFLVSSLLWNTDSANIRRKRELFRDNVDPKDGGKVPESNINRLELNKLDAMGLRDTRGKFMSERLKNTILSDKAGGSTPFGSVSASEFSNPGFFSPAGYYEEEEEYVYEPPKPKGPVLLKERPNEVKEIQPVPITIHEVYTSFDCRSVPHSDRHYADTETGCTTYHFCHANGKQDSFTCPTGTIFNEYLGTCDHTSAVKCSSAGKGYESISTVPYKSYHTNTYAPAHNYYADSSSQYSSEYSSPSYSYDGYNHY
ncbi:uncharacterized protein [Lepeophtheirus salmonis]|uniref:uncharacterized protein n=1 Tax=Lepeophtheirus salmonis TaxID=72036 RepID=UPI001AEB5C74|nr:uncharacterized protein LOC121129384 [Lepeophtheirus salmonis]